MTLIGKMIRIAVLGTLLQACGGEPPSEPSAGAASEPSAAPRTEAPPGASVFFITPANGATTSSPLTVKFGISGMEVAPAGTYASDTGHHHLLIDTELSSESLPVAKDDNHLHFGNGQTETTVTLPPGEHTLQLVLGDGNHIPHDPPVKSEIISIVVE